MGRFGPSVAKFYSLSDLSTPLAVSGVSTKQPLSVVAEEFRDGEGGSTLVFTNDTALNTLAAKGNVCWVTKTDAVRDDLLPDGVTVCEPFIIQSRVAGPTPNQITISGPDLLSELKRWLVYRPLGAETLTSTTLSADAPGPATRTLAQAAGPGAEIILTTPMSGSGDLDKEIRIELDDGRTHVTTVKSRITDESNNKWIVMEHRLPAAASSGNDVELRTRKVKLTDAASFRQGVEALIQHNSGVLTTVVASVEANTVMLREALPDAAVAGHIAQSKDYSAKNVNDVTALISGHAPGWTVALETGNGTERGTRYAGGGESVYNILRSIAAETGEMFRLRSAEFSPMGPKRELVWRRTHDTAGVGGTLRLVFPTSDAAMATDTANKNRAILIERPRHSGEYDPVTRVSPVAGSPEVTLFSCTPTAVAAAAAEGFEIVTTGLGLYAPPLVKNTALDNSIGIHHRPVNFSEVTVEGDNVLSIAEAADKLLWLSIGYLKSHNSAATATIEAVCVSPVGVRPGQCVELYFASPTGEYVLDYTSSMLYVTEVRREVSNTGEYPGAPITILTLSPTPSLPTVHTLPRRPVLSPAFAGNDSVLPGGRTLGNEVGRRLQAVDRLASRVGQPSIVSMAVSASAPISGGGVTDHGALTGLEDDDHPNLWNDTRGDAKIATHAADDDAHHAPVTAGNAAIALDGQEVSVALADDSGLEINDGLAAVAPATLSAETSNSRAAGTHAVAAADDTVAGGVSLLKSDEDGRLALAGLGVGAAATDTAALKVTPLANDDYGIHLKQKAGQTADLWRVDDSDGNALIRLTAGGNLESGNPGFVSGQTGWRMTPGGDLEANSGRFRGELHSTTFVADEMHALGGTLLAKTAGVVAAPVSAGDNELPAIDESFTLQVNASWGSGTNYFPVGSILRIKPMSETAAGGSLDLYDFHLQVTAVGTIAGRDLSQGNPGAFPLTCVRRLGGETGVIIPTGASVVLWAKVGSSYSGAVKIASDEQYGPFIDVFTVADVEDASWGGVAPVTKPRVRQGNLRGVLGKSADEWGFALGTDLSSTALNTPSIVASDLAGLVIRNVDQKAYNGIFQTVHISSTGNVKLGTDVSAAAATTFDFNATTGAVRFGPLGIDAANLYWDESKLSLRQNTTEVITLDSSGDSYFAGAMKIGASGGIWQATGGGFASPTDGLKIWNVGGKGQIGLFSGGTRYTTLKDTGIEIAASVSQFSRSAVTFTDVPDGEEFGGLYGYGNSSTKTISLYVATPGTLEFGQLIMSATDTNTYMQLQSGSTAISLDSDNDYVKVHQASLYVEHGGVAVGYPSYTAINRGQIASDIYGTHNYNALILQDTGVINHGMTSLVASNTYGALGKADNAFGGMAIVGATEGIAGLWLRSYGLAANTAKNGNALGAVLIDGGLNGGSMSANGNLLVIRNHTHGAAKWIVDAEGDFHYDGAGSAYDSYDDVALLQTLSNNMWGGAIDAVWNDFVDYNRDTLVAAGVISPDGFVSGKSLDRLLVGGILQTNYNTRQELDSVNRRLERLEALNG